MLEYLEKPPLSGTEKQREFPVTACLQNVTINIKF